jgi:hypothetical protein
MAGRVVQRLESIDVDQEERRVVTGSPVPFDRSQEHVVHVTSVVRAGQGIRDGLPLERADAGMQHEYAEARGNNEREQEDEGGHACLCLCSAWTRAIFQRSLRSRVQSPD